MPKKRTNWYWICSCGFPATHQVFADFAIGKVQYAGVAGGLYMALEKGESLNDLWCLWFLILRFKVLSDVMVGYKLIANSLHLFLWSFLRGSKVFSLGLTKWSPTTNKIFEAFFLLLGGKPSRSKITVLWRNIVDKQTLVEVPSFLYDCHCDSIDI